MSLGCEAAYQLLPRSPTSKIHGLSWKPLSHAPQGVRRSSTTSPRVWRECHRGGSLAIGIARFTVNLLVTGGRHTQMTTTMTRRNPTRYGLYLGHSLQRTSPHRSCHHPRPHRLPCCLVITVPLDATQNGLIIHMDSGVTNDNE
jgi:hypothetical protein